MTLSLFGNEEEKNLMKALISLLFITFQFAVFSQSSSSILEAIENKSISVTSIKNTGGYHGQFIQLKVINNTYLPIIINVPAGQKFNSKSSSIQDLMVLKANCQTIQPKEYTNYKLYVGCIQAHNAGPNNEDDFKVGQFARGYLLKIAQFIGSNNYYRCSTAQSAIWAITDGYSIDNIYANDILMAKGLATIVANATGKKVPQFIPTKPLNIVSIRTNIFFRLQKRTRASLDLYDNDGNLINKYFTNRMMTKGPYDILLGINQIDNAGAVYHIKLTTADSCVLMTKRIDEMSTETDYSIKIKIVDFDYLIDKEIKGTLTVTNQKGEVTNVYYKNKILKKGKHQHTITLKYIAEIDSKLTISLTDTQDKIIQKKVINLLEHIDL